MKKSHKGFIAISSVVMLLVVAEGAYIYATRQTDEGARMPSSMQITDAADTIYINKGTITVVDPHPKYLDVRVDAKTYAVNLATKELSLYEEADPQALIAGYAGLPPFVNDEHISTDLSFWLFSQDKKQLLVVVATRDNTVEPEGFGGTSIITKEEEFRCAVAEKRCYPSTIILDADIASRKPQRPYPHYEDSTGTWLKWNADNGLLFGYQHGEGGSHDPVLIYDVAKKRIITVRDREGYPWIAAGVNANFDKVWIIDEIYERNDPMLKLYAVGTTSAELMGEYKISALAAHDKDSIVRSVAWSDDGSSLRIKTNSKIYSLDLATGIETLVVDATQAFELQKTIQGPEHSGVAEVLMSPSGRYVYFVDKQKDEETREDVYTLKTIDLQNNNAVTGIVTGDYISTFEHPASWN